MQPVKLPRTVPVVLSMQEAAALIAVARNIKHQAALSVAYGAGLRCQRGLPAQGRRCRQRAHGPSGRARQGRQGSLRHVEPRGAAASAAWWRIGRAQGKIFPNGWLFPGLDPMELLTARQLNRAVHDAAAAAGIAKRVTTHTLRHLRHAPAGTQGRHPRHPGAAGPQEAGDDIDLRPRGDRSLARGDRPAGGVAAQVVRRPPWGAALPLEVADIFREHGPAWREASSRAT